jgi:hypothetical protein
MKLLEGVDGALISVVKEQVTDRTPDDVGSGLWNLDHLHESGCHRVVEPGDDALIPW